MERDFYRHPERFPGNADGPFYTTGYQLDDGTWCGDCMFCGTPEMAAPTLLSPVTGEDANTYFVRQPSTAEEIEQACEAIDACCVGALRYGGRDPRILAKLPAASCDYRKPGYLHRLVRLLFSKRSAI
ncbi:ferredoxin [Massilia violaceinigra]|uniref:Ferredoxin n=1 Tax=Massilia violaceinigra TaxID=2045208 RepID=A0ABY4A053_9BURK|nr:ferredoxin [Massilia violaceinigra]UOD28048.1 ferredoxin [Massilia violaceinigra]